MNYITTMKFLSFHAQRNIYIYIYICIVFECKKTTKMLKIRIMDNLGPVWIEVGVKGSRVEVVENRLILGHFYSSLLHSPFLLQSKQTIREVHPRCSTNHATLKLRSFVDIAL